MKLVPPGVDIIVFHASWCGHCRDAHQQIMNMKDAAPERVCIVQVDPEAGIALGPKYDDFNRFAFTKMKTASGLAKAFGVNYYPTILVVCNGALYEYKGSRDDSMLTELARDTASVISTILTAPGLAVEKAAEAIVG
jgi:thiol-disulfide isomerase/thioredoxin